jgi:hypothetical protein
MRLGFSPGRWAIENHLPGHPDFHRDQILFDGVQIWLKAKARSFWQVDAALRIRQNSG